MLLYHTETRNGKKLNLHVEMLKKELYIIRVNM